MNQEYNKENINELAMIAFMKMQLPPHRMRRDSAAVGVILREDPWWRSLDAVTHQQIGKVIKKNFDNFVKKYPAEIYYNPFSKSASEYIHDEDKKDQEKEYVYHYTDVGTFLGIIGGKMRLSNSLIMNDKKESSYYLDHLIEETKRRIAHNAKALADFDKNYAALYESLYETPTYLMSFTDNGDDAAQWERYAYGGEGVCIIFEKNALATIAGKDAIELDYVNYRQDYRNCGDVDELVDFIENGKLPTNVLSITEVFDFFGCRSALFKHPSFRSENEYRMYYSSQRHNRKPRGLKREETHDGRIREFYEFDWLTYAQKEGKSAMDVVDSVIIGPKAKVNKDILRRKIQDMSAKNKSSQWTGGIIDSDCPLR